MPAPAREGEYRDAGVHALDDAVHAVVQPLTALIFLLDIGLGNPDPQAWQAALKDARTECLRAIGALEQVRRDAHALISSGESR